MEKLDNLIAALNLQTPKLLIDVIDAKGKKLKNKYTLEKIQEENQDVRQWFNSFGEEIFVHHHRRWGSTTRPTGMVTHLNNVSYTNPTQPNPTQPISSSFGLNASHGLGFVEIGKLHNYDEIKAQLDKEREKTEKLEANIKELEKTISDNNLEIKINEYKANRKTILSPETLNNLGPLIAPLLEKLMSGTATTGLAGTQQTQQDNLSEYQKEMIKIIATSPDDVAVTLYNVFTGLTSTQPTEADMPVFTHTLGMLLKSYGIIE